MAEEAEAVVQEAAPEAVVSSQPTRDYEKEARSSGWVPENEFKGEKRPAAFVDAETFVKRGEEFQPFIKAENKRLREEMERREKEFDKRVQRLEKTTKSAFDSQQSHYERTIANLRLQKEHAVAGGDLETYRALEKEERSLKAPEAPPEAEAADPEEVFAKDNPWYGQDDELTAVANGISQAHRAKNPNASLQDNLRHTQEKVRALFPDKFGVKKPAANAHAAVDGGGEIAGARPPRGKGYGDLPPEARAACDKFVATIPGFKKETYIKEYFA